MGGEGGADSSPAAQPPPPGSVEKRYKKKGERGEEAGRAAVPSRSFSPLSRGSSSPPGCGSESAHGRPVHRSRAEPLPQNETGEMKSSRRRLPPSLAIPCPTAAPQRKDNRVRPPGADRGQGATCDPQMSQSELAPLPRRGGAGRRADHVTGWPWEGTRRRRRARAGPG